MFTKNKILLGLALALFTFAAPNRAQADPFPFFFRTSVSYGNDAQGNSWYYSPDFGWFFLKFNDPNLPYPPWIFKWSFGPIKFLATDANGDYFYDLATNDILVTNAQYYEYQQAGVAYPPHWFYSMHLSALLYYIEDGDPNGRRLFYNYTERRWMYYDDISYCGAACG
jgi:hypothetical protein